MKIRLEKHAINNSKLTGGKNEKPRREDLKWKTMPINGPMQILLYKSKEGRTEVIFRLLFTFSTYKYRNIWTFLIHFHACFTIMMSRV